MIRGAMVLFTAMFSVIFLKRRLYVQHFAGLALVVMGIAIVGLSSVLYNAKGMRLITSENGRERARRLHQGPACRRACMAASWAAHGLFLRRRIECLL
jgi:drug/metabolite transporter (DMT)-like permease